MQGLTFYTYLARQVFRGDLAVSVHKNNQGAAVLVFHDKSLGNLVRVYAQLARRFARAAVLDIVVGMFMELNAVVPQQMRGRRFRYVFFFGHGRCSGARMVFGVQSLEAFAGNMSIDLRGRDVGVAQQHLHHAQVGSVIKQMGGERMA